MAKKVKTIQLQSPENYIRTRARNLEIFECLINPDWKTQGIANVVVARKHTNGNVTAAIYLVDLFCLGVKDTMYLFNVSEPEYRKKLHPIHEVDPFIKIEYILAHNIIYAAIEFAEDYGFIPHKDFTFVTKYILAEDTEDIELIDIECGQDGKPAYYQGENDNKATVARILKQLEHSAGSGNYNFTIEEDVRKFKQVSDSDDEIDDEFDIGDDDEEDDMTYEEAVSVFRMYYRKVDTLKKNETQSFFEAVEVLFENLVDEDDFDNYYEEFFDDLDIELEKDGIPDEMLGLPKSESHNFNKLKSQLKPILELPEKKFNKGKKMVVDLKKDFVDIPLLAFLILHFEQDKANEVFTKELGYYVEKYPDYPLIKITSLIHSFLINLDQTTESELISLHDIFPGRESIHEFEMQQYLVYAVFVVLMGSDKSRLAALYEALVDLEFPDDFMELAFSLIIAEKIKAVAALTGEIE